MVYLRAAKLAVSDFEDEVCLPVADVHTRVSADIVYIVKFGNTYAYNIPSFPVITVRLRHAIIQHVDRDGQAKLADVFITEDLTLQMRTPTSFEVKEACFLSVSIFATFLLVVLLSLVH